MEIKFSVVFGTNRGFGFEKDAWQNQHAKGFFFHVNLLLVSFEVRAARDAKIVGSNPNV